MATENDVVIKIATVNGTGLRQRERPVDEVYFPDGRSRRRQKLLSVQHPGSADLVRDSRNRRRLPGTIESRRYHGGDERADLHARHDRSCARWLVDLRLDLAPQSAAGSRRHYSHRHSVFKDVQ